MRCPMLNTLYISRQGVCDSCWISRNSSGVSNRLSLIMWSRSTKCRILVCPPPLPMDHAPDIAPVLVENRADDGSVGARGRKHELAYRQRAAGHRVGQPVLAAVYQIGGRFGIVGFRIFLRQYPGEHVVPGRGQTVAAHAAVVLVFVGSLSERGETHDRAAGSDMRVIDHVASAQSGRDGAVDDDRAHQICPRRRLAAVDVSRNPDRASSEGTLPCR